MNTGSDLFENTEFQRPKKSRAKPRVLAHVDDAGPDAICFVCSKCGWKSGWLINDMSISESKRGIPCDRCNKKLAE